MEILTRIRPSFLFTLYCITFFIIPGSLFAADIAAYADDVKGTVWAQVAGEVARKLKNGSPIYIGDNIKTESNSTILIKFKDDTKFYLGAETVMDIDTFIYKKSGQEDSISSRIIKGTFRFVTGLIARNKPESMEVSTAVATIGIRGTNVVGEADATSATIILIEPENSQRQSIIEVSNQFGSVIIDEPGYGTEIPDEFSPPSPPRRMRLQTINNIMRSIQSIQRINIPRPR